MIEAYRLITDLDEIARLVEDYPRVDLEEGWKGVRCGALLGSVAHPVLGGVLTFRCKLEKGHAGQQHVHVFARPNSESEYGVLLPNAPVRCNIVAVWFGDGM